MAGVRTGTQVLACMRAHARTRTPASGKNGTLITSRNDEATKLAVSALLYTLSSRSSRRQYCIGLVDLLSVILT